MSLCNGCVRVRWVTVPSGWPWKWWGEEPDGRVVSEGAFDKGNAAKRPNRMSDGNVS